MAPTEHPPAAPFPPIDVAVLGGGAAGLLAAIRAAGLGARTVLFEKNAKPGAKILASGGGRCNVTTALEGRRLEAAFEGDQARFLRFALRAFPPPRIRALLEERGVPTRIEAFDKVFPEDGRASSVLLALLRAAADAGVVTQCGAPVRSLRVAPPAGFEVGIGGGRPRIERATSVVLAVGGCSYPKAGTVGEGYALAGALGHELVPRYPALVGLVAGESWLRGLAGVAVPLATTRLQGSEGGPRLDPRPVLFTHEGLSGPGPMNQAGAVAARGGGTLVIDLVPDRPFEVIDRALAEKARMEPRRLVAHLLPDVLPERLCRALLECAGVAAGTVGGRLSREARRALVHRIKGLEVRVTGTLGFERAEVTKGGVALASVDPRTMASRRVPGLYVAGEVLDVDGPIGGFNFQAAFATGWIAGEAAARHALAQGATTGPGSSPAGAGSGGS